MLFLPVVLSILAKKFLPLIFIVLSSIQSVMIFHLYLR